MDFAAVMVDDIVPPYRALMESDDRAQAVQTTGRETKLDKFPLLPTTLEPVTWLSPAQRGTSSNH